MREYKGAGVFCWHTQYTYVAENRLTQVQEFAAGNSTAITTSSYRYDGLGRRIEKVANGQTKRYIYDGEDILLEYNGSNVLQARYTHGPGIDEPIAVTKGATTFFYHQDGLGSVTDLTDSAGGTAKSYSYDAYGNILDSPGAVDQPYTYTGRELDSETGLYYYRARYYDAGTGRFLEKDPIGFSGGDINLYNYAFNSPLLYTDPYGLEVQVCRQPALGFLPVDHQWIKTDTLERGMGGTRGNVAGNESGDWPGDPVQITDHSGRSHEPGASCKAVDNVDENKVNKLLELGRPLGRWTSGNQCQSFVGDVLKKSRNSPGASGKWEGGATGNW
ncbi:MAG: hypothetical protein LKG23_05185 [Nitrospira sp.]|jgi:RHS repeat-associated protein|nr:hypothetical protein [Nitrospira sp.]